MSFFSSIVHAQQDAAAGLDAGALQQQLQKENPNAMPQSLPEPVKPTKEEPAPDEKQAKVTVRGIRFSGVNLDNEAELQTELQAYLGKSYSLQGLQKFPDVISAYYRKKGRVVQCVLLPQTIQEDGIITLSVLEAKLGSVIVENPPTKVRINDYTVRKYITTHVKNGASLDTEAIKHGVALLNELPGIKAQSALEAGKLNSETNVIVSLGKASLIQGNLSVTNHGSRSTGVEQGSANVNLTGPFKIGDQATVFGSYSLGSQFTQFGYTLPVGYRGLRLGVSGNYLNYENIDVYRVNGGKGSAWTAGATLSYPLLREQGSNANLMAGYNHKRYLNSNLATNLTNSQYGINSFSLGLSGNHHDELLGGGSTDVTSNAMVGQLDIDDSSPSSYSTWVDSNRQLHRYTPENFQKLTGTLNHNRSLPLIGAHLMISMNGQWSAQNLNSSEQFYLGGPNGVRAYPVAQGGGSQGLLGSLELQKQLPKNLIASLFVDSGVVKQYSNPYPNWQGLTAATNVYNLTGAGLGLKWNYKGFLLSGIVAWKLGQNPLLSQKGIVVDNDNTNNSPRGWLNAGYNF